jgi:hypothetical protein
MAPVTVWAVPCRAGRQRSSRRMGNPKRFIGLSFLVTILKKVVVRLAMSDVNSLSEIGDG